MVAIILVATKKHGVVLATARRPAARIPKAVMTYRQFSPACDLQTRVRSYWTFEKGADESPSALYRVMPSSTPYLIFQIEGTFVCREGGGKRALRGIVGNRASKEPSVLSLSGRNMLVGVSFRTGESLGLSAFSPHGPLGFHELDTPWVRGLHAELVDAFTAAGYAGLDSILDRAFCDHLDHLDHQRRTLDWNKVESCLLKGRRGVGLGELPRLLGISTRTFQRACLRDTGHTPREYRTLIRCESAFAALMAPDDPPLSALAYRLGFYDQAHLCRAFKRWTAMTPMECRSHCLRLWNPIDSRESTAAHLPRPSRPPPICVIMVPPYPNAHKHSKKEMLCHSLERK